MYILHRMFNEESYVVIFPTIFAKKAMNQLVSNVKNILKAREQQFESVWRDGDVILVHANDPVFASSTITTLFGVRMVAIARSVKNEFTQIVSTITSVGGNLLLRGERFLVKVDGFSRGFLPKDVEIAATSKIIEERADLGAIPGTSERFDKELYTHMTKKWAYICIFTDRGAGGNIIVPGTHIKQQKTICAIYDEISAVSCYETMRQGYNVDIIICYKRNSDLAGLVKITSRIIQRMVQDVVKLEFFRVNSEGGYLQHIETILQMMMMMSNEYSRISIAVPPSVFPVEFVDRCITYIVRKDTRQIIPLIPLAGSAIFDVATEIGFGDKEINRLEKIIQRSYKIHNDKAPKSIVVETAIETRKTVSIKIGPNNVHDILDSIG